jgi:hypothetical protein
MTILKENIDQIQSAIRNLREEYEEQTSVKFVLDGIILNSLGQIHAMEKRKYRIVLDGENSLHHGKNRDGKLVRITTTQRAKVIIIMKNVKLLLVLRLGDNATFTEIYFGSGKKAWDAGHSQKGNSKKISVSKLEALNKK